MTGGHRRVADADAAGLELDTKVLGALPVINALIDRLGLGDLLQEHLRGVGERLKLSPATVIGVVVRNLVISRRPVYALGEWAVGFNPALLALAPGQAELLNDHRMGRCLA